ncbi:MAG: flagellar motor protein MotD [Kangiella sp.]|nr:MAG: flagellar motor protein MotD [Kangiella sp.]
MRRVRNNINEHEQDVNRWLISYADFITLLFAFFVVLYSISQVDVSKYKDLSVSLEGVFQSPELSTKPIQIGEVSKSLTPITGDNSEQPDLSINQNESENDLKDQEVIDSENFASSEEFKDLENGLKASLGDLIDQELAEIKSDPNWINVVLKSGLLFPSGNDQLNEGAGPLMEEVAKHLNKNRQLILVHGHTDNIPIATERFPSNWELSSARGVAVVRALQNLNVIPNRLSVEGHGEYQPVTSNDTEAGRKENRRVVISISRKQRIPDSSLFSESENSNAPISDSKFNSKNKDEEMQYEIIKLPGGGILIRGKDNNAEN